MRPLELIIDGFRSFDRRARFDWRGRSLVGIVGPIGSGKSSILDAISFALYAKTPVFERENKTLINHGRQRARVELAFDVDGQSWRAVRVIKRKGASQHVLLRTDDGATDPTQPVCERERAVNDRIEELLGLDFQAFNRSILLAQNRFARFLNASPTDRDRVLKGVFGFDRVDAMHERAKHHRAQAQLAVGHLDGQLATLDDDRARLAEARTSLATTAAESTAIEACVSQVRTLLQREHEAARSAARHETRLGELDALTVRVPSQDEIDQASDATRQATAALRQAETARESARSAMTEAERARAETVAQYGSSDTLTQAESTIALRARAQRTVDRHQTAQAAAARLDTDTQTDVETARQRAQTQAEVVETARTTLAERECARGAARDTLAAYEARFGDRSGLERAQKQLDELTRERGEVERARSDREREATALAQAEDRYEEAVTAHAAAAAAERKAERDRQASQAVVREADTALEVARDHDVAQTLVQQLTIGAPCPVCQQPVPALPPATADHLEAATTARAAAEQAAEQTRESLRKATVAAATARAAMTHANTMRSGARQRWQDAGERLRTSETACSTLSARLTDRLGLGDPTQRLAEAHAEFEQRTAAVDQAERAASEAADALRDAEHRLSLTRERATTAEARAKAQQQQQASTAKALETACTEVEEANETLRRLLGMGDPVDRLQTARQHVRKAEADLDAAREAERRCQGEAETTVAERETSRQAEQALERRLATLAGSIGAEASADETPKDETSAGETQSLRARKATLDRQLRAALVDATEARDAARQARQATADERRGLLEPLDLSPSDDFDAAVARLRSAHDHAQATVASLADRVARADDLVAERAQAEKRLATYRTLADELTAPRFLRYLLDEERAALADLGSRRFEMLTGGRYRFSDDGSFDVVDLANAETVRKSDTLSGGETFLASLALALALAETVTSAGGRLDAFFLDEGFGSLDDEHLDFAMEGIERLVTDAPNRLVTVVSHVHAMRDRIDDLIVLDKDPITGASIVVSGAG